MEWICEIFWVCVVFNIQLLPEHITSEDNDLADALSRIPYAPSLNASTTRHIESLCCSNELIHLFSRFESTRQPSPHARPGLGSPDN